MAVCTTHFIDGIVCTCTCILNSLIFASLHKYKISLLTSDVAVFTKTCLCTGIHVHVLMCVAITLQFYLQVHVHVVSNVSVDILHNVGTCS